MRVLKGAINWARKNKIVSEAILSARGGMRGAWRGVRPRGNLATFMGVGAGIGAVRGMADNLMGQDRVSVLGGMMQGATMGAGLYGGRAMFRRGFGTRAAGIANAGAIRNNFTRGRGPLMLPYRPMTAGKYPGRVGW